MNANMNDNDNAGANAAGGANGADGSADNAADSQLDAEARLDAADPAAGLEPSAGFVDDVLARTVGAAAADAHPDPASEPAASEPAPVHDLAVERARRRPRWLPIAAVAASIAIVGGAAFGLGSATGGNLMAGGPLNPADGAAPPVSLQSGAGALSPQGESAASGASGLLTPEPMRMGSSGDRMSMPWSIGRNSFSSSGLSSASGSAAGYGYDARAASTPERIEALAAALGIEGTATLQDGAWLVRPRDGSAPALYASLDGTLSFNYNNPTVDPWQCDQPDPATQMCPLPTDLPSEQAAIDALRAIVTGAGRDADTFEFTSETWEGSYTRSAQAWPVVDGRRIDQAWSIELTDAGVYSVYGSLADIVPLGDYIIVSEQDAFERLSDPRFGAQMTAMSLAMRAQTEPILEAGEWVPPTEPPATPVAGAALAWPVTDVEIVSARLGLTNQWQPDGSVLVVPAYEFTDADGGTWSVIAVADSMLNFAGN